jgi:hypothetical protein
LSHSQTQKATRFYLTMKPYKQFKRLSIPSLFLIGLSFFTVDVFAEINRWQNYEIHYTTLNSMLIPSEVAKAHNITRSKSRIVTNITVRKDDTAVAAKIEGTSTNLLNQLFTLDFQEVKEPGAIYYLSNQIIDERDMIRFQITIAPNDHDDVYILKFNRNYFQAVR